MMLMIIAGSTQWFLENTIYKEKALLQYVCLYSAVVCSTLENHWAISSITTYMPILLGIHSRTIKCPSQKVMYKNVDNSFIYDISNLKTIQMSIKR